MTRVTLLLLLVLAMLDAGAATVYVTSELQFGLHADKSSSSPILKLVPSGTALELIKTEGQASFVRTPDGSDGWIDSSYLVQQPVATVSSEQTGTALAETATDTLVTPEGSEPVETLEQQLKSERVRIGELQVQIAELRKRLGQDGSNDSLYEKIDQLAMEKKQLEVQLAQLVEGAGEQSLPPLSGNSGAEGLYNLRNTLIFVAVALVAGIIAGLYLMDFLYRRRHGGFRI